MMIPVRVLVLFISVLPFVGVAIWATFTRSGGGSYDFGIDVWFFAFIAIIIGLSIWAVYGLLT